MCHFYFYIFFYLELRTTVILGLNEAPVNDSLLDLFYMHRTPSFLQDNLHKEQSVFRKKKTVCCKVT